MKKRYIFLLIFFIFAIFLITALILNYNKKRDNTQNSQIPNPASVYCEEQGGTLEIRTNSDGSQTGYCIFPDGFECEEWVFYRGECEK